MASQGLIAIEPAIAIIMGANIGTCVTAILSAIGKPKAAMRVAVSHVLFKVFGVLIWFALFRNWPTWWKLFRRAVNRDK